MRDRQLPSVCCHVGTCKYYQQQQCLGTTSLSSKSDIAPRGLEDNPSTGILPSPDRDMGNTPRNCCLYICKKRPTRSLVLINIYVCANRMTRILYCSQVEGMPAPTSPHNPNRLKAISKLTPTIVVPSSFASSHRHRRREGLITLLDSLA
jgi:hypothetical protein